MAIRHTNPGSLGGDDVQPNVDRVSKARRLFVKRERIRRELMRTKPGETICLQSEDVEILLVWLKELEKRGGNQWE